MRKVIANVFKVMVVLLIITWIAVIFIDYLNVINNKEPQFCIKEETKTYDDGTVYSCTGLGYKLFRYERKSISAVEFGPFFIQERQS